ncbi:MAG: primosomal protein N' [Nitrospira sp.]|nr:primosomal protein N' [Nitrospira sp.]
MSVPRFADVIVPRHLHRIFTYGIPDTLRRSVHIGSLVQVPLGASTVPGVVVAFPAEPPKFFAQARTTPLHLRDILASEETAAAGITPDLLDLSRNVADYYLAPWGQCLRLIFPALAAPSKPARRSRKAAAKTERPPLRPETPPLPATPVPSWWPQFEQALAEHRHETFLIEGPLASRWAVLLDATRAALAAGTTVLIVSPEIRRAAALAALGSACWPERVVLLHSELRPDERARRWERIGRGEADVVVGTRSAVFAPLRAPGLICVDEEEASGLKEEPEPHYHARAVAAMRAARHHAILLLGTAHPSIETRESVGTHTTHSIQTAPQTHTLTPARQAAVHLVDLRQMPPRTLLSEAMLTGLRAAMADGSGAILFANRKGFAAALHCRDCGAAPACAHCTVPLTLYRNASRLACRYCGATQSVPDTCPSCHSPRIEPVGTGTERLEEELRRLLPGARIGRLDRETARTAEQVATLRRSLTDKQLDIVIGTQLLFQDLPMPLVGCVGIPYADAGLHRPDFRSAERTYQMLRDAVGLAHPDGQVILQTALPDHHAIAAIAHNDPEKFYGQELSFRQALGYPPFGQLISLRVSGKTDAAVKTAAESWASALKAHANKSSGALIVLGPIPASVERIRGRYRWQILVKSSSGDLARTSVRATLDKMEAEKAHRGLKFDVDVDPIEIG